MHTIAKRSQKKLIVDLSPQAVMFGNTFHCQLAIHSPVYVCVFFGSVALRDEMRRVVYLRFEPWSTG